MKETKELSRPMTILCFSSTSSTTLVRQSPLAVVVVSMLGLVAFRLVNLIDELLLLLLLLRHWWF